MIAPYPGPENQAWKPSCPLRPFFGVDPAILDEKVCISCSFALEHHYLQLP